MVCCLGIDLGLRTFAAFTDEAIPPIEAERFYRGLEPALAIAQRARHRNRARAIHAKLANRRKDFLHKLSTLFAKASECACRESTPWNAALRRRRGRRCGLGDCGYGTGNAYTGRGEVAEHSVGLH